MTAENQEEQSVSFTLLENGLDSILEGLRRLRGTPTPSDLKFATLVVWSGALLILKERLRRKDWRLIALDPSSVDEKKYTAGDFISVDYPALRKRLKKECGIALSSELRGHLQGLRSRRNRLEHFQIQESREAVLSSIAQVAGDLLRFVGEHLEPEGLDGASEELVRQIREEVAASEVMLEVHLEPVLQALADAGTEALECPRCNQETLALDEPVSCRFCGFREAGGEARAEEFISSVLGVDRYRTVKHGGEWPQYECPECQTESLVKLETDYGDRHVCLECAAIWPPGTLATCDRCGALMARGDLAMCETCWSDLTDRD